MLNKPQLLAIGIIVVIVLIVGGAIAWAYRKKFESFPVKAGGCISECHSRIATCISCLLREYPPTEDLTVDFQSEGTELATLLISPRRNCTTLIADGQRETYPYAYTDSLIAKYYYPSDQIYVNGKQFQ